MAGINRHLLTGGENRPKKAQGDLEQVVLRTACRPGRTSWSFPEGAARGRGESKCHGKQRVTHDLRVPEGTAGFQSQSDILGQA